MAKESRLHFEDTEMKPPSKLSHAIKTAPLTTVSEAAHRKRDDSEDENVGVESAHKTEEAVEGGIRTLDTAHRSRKEGTPRDTAHHSSHTASRRAQREGIKKEYNTARAAGNTAKTSEAAKAVKKGAEEGQKAASFVVRHRKGIFLAGLIASVLLIFSTVISSCSVLLNGLGGVSGATYSAEDAEMLAAEERYCAMEAELQGRLDNYAAEHGYDEYLFELDEIGHDPYVLLSMLHALCGGKWKAEEIGDTLQMLFDAQYTLTETVTAETRYRPEVRTGMQEVYDPFSMSWYAVPYTYTENVPFSYTICSVKLENADLSHVPVLVLNEDQLSVYAMYMSSLGNRPDLFPDSAYVGSYYNTDYEKYEIPPEALQDEQFAAMIAEAEKYLGYPYVWCGSSPSTSFDCSGFVSWVLNHSGRDVGRLTAEGLRQACTRVSPANARPGDLIFFEKTYNTTGASHVGIYVGNGMMLHCGDPIQYTSIETSYWQNHFLQFGRLPRP